MKNLLFVNKKKQKNVIHSHAADARPSQMGHGPSAGNRMKFFCFFLFTKRSLTFLLLLTLTLTACGRKGPPNAPGPPEKVTFPRSYPAR